ncbi:hypothetical protein ACFT7S_20155 [Streptomyces sp. NPDC057136]|uniref:hypothetical protein n=1 Tax=Streptomyces sp. NPDC057136 TaxID=3346029 RepID=UPI00362F4C9E
MANRLEDTDPKSVQSTYAERFAADLVANRSEQGELTATIAQLQTRLEQLKKDEGWLAGMQGTLPTAAPTAQPLPTEATETAPLTDTTPDAKAVPQPRSAKGTRTKAAQPKAAAKKPAAAAKSTSSKTVKKASGGNAIAKKATEAAGPKDAEAPLHQLLREFLPAGEPRLVREVHADLEKVYPDRKTSAQVVRNSLETLVKRGIISKEIQQGSAMYTAPKSTADSEAADVEVSATA